MSEDSIISLPTPFITGIDYKEKIDEDRYYWTCKLG